MLGVIYWRERVEGKTKLKHTVRVFRQHIHQPQYQQLKVDWNLRVCGNCEFRIFFAPNVFKKYKFKVKLRNEVPAKIQNKTE